MCMGPSVRMSRTAVFRWCSDFRHGRVSTADMPRPGQARVVITQESIAAVRENRRITTREIADSLSVSKGTVDTILHERLQYNKVYSQWVPKNLTEDQKYLRMGVCFEHLLRYRTEGNNFLSRLVACDETWCHFFDPATKQMTMERRHSFIHLYASMLSHLVTMDLSKFIQVEYNLIFNKHTLGTTINI